eukprot:gene1397-1613_t
MFTVNKPRYRFNLVLMDEGEYYFDDYSAAYYPPCDTDDESYSKEVTSIEHVSTSVPQNTANGSAFLARGRSAVATGSQPLAQRVELFAVTTNQVIEMKENNVNAPYKFKKQTRAVFRFSLNYVSLSLVLDNIQGLLVYARQERSDHDRLIKSLIEERENRLQFDLSLLVDMNEHNILEHKCFKISPLVENPGRLLLTNSHLYFQPMNNIETARINHFPLDSINKVLKRRHSLREIGLEIFFDDDTSLVFTFKKNEVYNVLTTDLCRNISSVNEQKNYLLKWQNGIISNYEYLIYLNNLAGRTYNDLTQYPVFPWVIADYTSKELDLSKPSTYRDLSKPIGALNPDRLSMFQERYHQIPEPQPKFLYGTHYSTPAYVLYYLVRQAPEYMLRLQNGRFDSPNRMFHSLEETWNSVFNSTSDVKELIPEFYEPSDRGDFLVNQEKLDLGVRQDGKVINDVILPPWAKDPEDFITTMRRALESEYVSQNLNNWIDLIFGYKQLGEESVRANNVFYHLTYEGSVDIESVTDPVERQSLEAQINEFGQTPRQLFKVPHPQRLPLTLRNYNANIESSPSTTTFEGDTDQQLLQQQQEQQQLNQSFGISNNSTISTSTQDLNDSFNNINISISGTNPTTVGKNWGSISNIQLKNSFKNHRDNSDIIYSVSQDASLKIYSLKDRKQVRSLNLCDLALSSLQLSSDERHIVIGSWDNNIGSWDSSVKVWRCSTSSQGLCIGKVPIADFIESESEIRSIDISPNGSSCVAGSDDGTLYVYDLRALVITGKMRIYHDAVTCVTFTPDGTRILATCIDGSIKLISIEGSEIFSGSIDDQINCLDTDGASMVVGCERGLRIWSLASGTELKDLSSQTDDSVQSINVSLCNGKTTVLVGSGNGTIHLFEA